MGSYKRVNEPSVPMKHIEVLDQLGDCQFFRILLHEVGDVTI